MSKVTVALFFNKKKKKQDGKCPVSLRVTYQRKQKYYSTKFAFTLDEWNRINSLTEKYEGKIPRGKYRDAKEKLDALKTKAVELVDEIDPFTWYRFEHIFLNKALDFTIAGFLRKKAKRLRGQGRIGTAVSNESAYRSIDEFQKGLKFVDLDVSCLEKYESWMLNKGRSVTTVGMYLRAVRSVFNDAINSGLIQKELYPFGKGRYEVPTGRNVKKALTLAEIGKLFAYEPQTQNGKRFKNYWLFLYLGGGLNVKDFARLKYKNIDGEMLVFERAKTKRTRRTKQAIRTPILPEMEGIIKKYGNPRKDEETYLFPILHEGVSPKREHALTMQATALINKYMGRIAKAIGVHKITSYTARHSYATVLKNSGASVEFIAESLGHASTKTTQNYLASFEDEQKRERAQVLIPGRPQMRVVKKSS